MTRAFAVLGLAALLASGCKDKSTTTTTADGGVVSSGKRIKIAVIPKGTQHEYWKSVHAGAVRAAQELDVDIVWKGPVKEDDLKAQIDVVDTFVAQGVSGICLAPLNDAALRTPVKSAKSAKIPTVIFDSDLQGDDHASFVATDNVAAGKIGADALNKTLGGKGNVVVLRYQEGSASTSNREKGFLDQIKTVPDLKIISDNQYGGATSESASQKAENLLVAHKAADGNVQGVFAPNESTTFGMLRGLRNSKTNGKVHFIGFDSSKALLEGLTSGDIDGLVVQNPMNMGYLCVKTMVDVLAGKTVEKRIDTGAQLVTKANMNDPAVKDVIDPDLKKWLKE